MEGNARPDSGARLLEVYVDLREESAALEEAYGRWSGAPERDRYLAFAVYKAALDREEQASIVYRDQLRQDQLCQPASYRCVDRRAPMSQGNPCPTPLKP
jgi:hypothetical protein